MKYYFNHYRNYNTTDGTPKAQGGMTICLMELDQEWLAAASYCSEKDNYNKYLGRIKSKGRLHARKRHAPIHITKNTAPNIRQAFKIARETLC